MRGRRVARPAADMVPTAELLGVVRELEDRRAIYHCVARCARGLDRFDRELLLSAYHPDATDDHGKFVGGPEEFADWVFAAHRKHYVSHHHALLNHLVDLDGAVAHGETYFQFVAMNVEGRAFSMTGGRYLDRFEKRGSDWRIAHRVCVREWAVQDAVVTEETLWQLTATSASLPLEEREMLRRSPRPTRDGSDPSYARPLEMDADRLALWRQLSHQART